MLALLQLYKKHVSGLLPPACRYYPTCSDYMAEAITTRGYAKGVLMGLWRLLRCNPLFPGGYDPVPGINTKRKNGFC